MVRRDRSADRISTDQLSLWARLKFGSGVWVWTHYKFEAQGGRWPTLRDITCIYAALIWEGIHKHSQEYGLLDGRTFMMFMSEWLMYTLLRSQKYGSSGTTIEAERAILWCRWRHIQSIPVTRVKPVLVQSTVQCNRPIFGENRYLLLEKDTCRQHGLIMSLGILCSGCSQKQ